MSWNGDTPSPTKETRNEDHISGGDEKYELPFPSGNLAFINSLAWDFIHSEPKNEGHIKMFVSMANLVQFKVFACKNKL